MERTHWAVGCLTAWVAKRAGCDVCLVDTNPARALVAAALGVGFALPADAPSEADAIWHTSGSPDGLRLALGLAALEATVVDMSWYGTQIVALPLGEAFHARRLVLKSSQVGRIAPSQRARWDSRRRMQLALSMLADPALDILVSGECALADLPSVMAQLAASAGDTLCHRIKY